jgi:hypothetical protein
LGRGGGGSDVDEDEDHLLDLATTSGRERYLCTAPLSESHTASRFVGCGLGLKKSSANSDFFTRSGGALGSPKFMCRRVLAKMLKEEEDKKARKEARRKARDEAELAQVVVAEAAAATAT